MKHSLKQDSKIYKVLFSSPTKLEGSYQQEDVLIEPVLLNGLCTYSSSSENSIGRYHYMLVFDFMPPPNEHTIFIPDYSRIGDYVCIALSVLYGKRFDNHGMIEGSGFFWMPHYEDLINFSPLRYYPTYSDLPRKDTSIRLELKEAASIIDFTVHRKLENEELFRYFFNAAKFYLSSIKSIHSDLDKAYLDLITCGEILSNFYDYSKDELLDDDLDKLLKRLSLHGIPDNDLGFIRGRLHQVKRKFFLTLKKLINESFFKATESRIEDGKFTQENIDKSIKAAYDLRSKYVHTGVEFKDWIQVYPSSEDHLSEVLPSGSIPNVDDEKLKKLIEKIPTYVGLERIMRFALLRFLHTNGIYIHCDLDS